MIPVTFANSDGCSDTGPSWIQRVAPLTFLPAMMTRQSKSTVPMTQTSAPLRTSLIGSFVSTNAVITLIERNRRCLAKWEYVLSPDMIFMY
mgnify:FL=1